MIIKSKTRLPVVATDREVAYPVLALMTGVLFPGTMLTIQVGRRENLELLESSYANGSEFVASYSHAVEEGEGDTTVHQAGVFAVVCDVRDGVGGSKVVTLEGLRRASLVKITATEPYLTAVAQAVDSLPYSDRAVQEKATAVISIVGEITQLDPVYSPEMSNVLKMNVEDHSLLADHVSATFRFPLASKQELLEAVPLEERYSKLLYYLNAELSRAATVLSINEKVRRRVENDQQNTFLRQQLHEIRKQLGEDFSEEKEAARWRTQVKGTPDLPQEAVDRARIEIDRLVQLSSASAEYGVTKSYLDWLLNLPWRKISKEDYQIPEVEKILSSEYYGPAHLKEQILQRLSIRKLLGGNDRGPTLCLVGVPGTGKASLAKAIAKALGKQMVRISVGGITDISEIKGSPRTYLGACPGKIVRTLRDTGVSDPLVLLEDIDYFNVENDSSVNMALLEAIDARYNDKFLDQYIGVPFDLSKVFFVCSVRSYEEIPEQFVPRLEIIELPGYIEREKIVIAKRYIIPNMLKMHGLVKSEFKVNDKVLGKIISGYTQEAGLLGFSQQIEKVFRKIALEKAEKGGKSWTISEQNLESYLGTTLFIPEKAETLSEIGIAAGLAWTGAGGELMFIEGLKMKGEGQIITTGSLGEVMRESIQAAHSYVRSKADVLGIDFNDFNEFDIHIHFPSGAIPKDGPSAGITVSLVIASVMSERPIRHDLAMTGEVTLRGKVLAVGGIKEKIAAAYRAGIRGVCIPKENEKDLKDLPKEILRKTKFHYIERVDDLFELCLRDFKPSTFTLEKVFAEEIEKVRNKQEKPSKPSKPAKPRAARKTTSKKK